MTTGGQGGAQRKRQQDARRAHAHEQTAFQRCGDATRAQLPSGCQTSMTQSEDGTGSMVPYHSEMAAPQACACWARVCQRSLLMRACLRKVSPVNRLLGGTPRRYTPLPSWRITSSVGGWATPFTSRLLAADGS